MFANFIFCVADRFVGEAVKNKDSGSTTAWGTDILSPLSNKQEEFEFVVLPNCYWDVGWSLNNGCQSKGFPGGSLETAFDSDITFSWGKNASTIYPGAFGYHWHNRWDLTPVKNSVMDLLFKDVNEKYEKLYLSKKDAAGS